MMAVPDPQALAAQQKVIDAQKEMGAMQMAQQVRAEKANKAINFILLPLQTKDGIARQDPEGTPESKAARAACYRFLEAYFSTTTDFEDGIAVREATAFGSEFLKA
jgi:hypothetical protein